MGERWMSGGGSDDDWTHANRPPIESDTVSRLHALLALLRGQFTLLGQTVREGGGHPGALMERLDGLRLTTQRLSDALQRLAKEATVAATPDAEPEAGGPEAKHSTPSQMLSRASCPTTSAPHSVDNAIRIELRQPHMRALVESGALASRDTDDPLKVQRVVQLLLDRWSGLYGNARILATKNPERIHERIPENTSERRSGRDRRHSAPRVNCLLSYITGSPLDRRKGSERRTNASMPSAAGAFAAQPSETGNVLARDGTQTNLIRLAEVRSHRNASRPLAEPGSAAILVPFRAAAGKGLAAGTGAQQVSGIERKRHPDSDKRDQSRVREGFPVQTNSEQEVTGRRDVLQQPDGRHADAPGPGDEQDQR